MKKIIILLIALFIYGCNGSMKENKCILSLQKATAWINLMPKIQKRDGPKVIIKLDLKKENCLFQITPKNVKIFFKNRICKIDKIDEIEETKKDIKITIRECQVSIKDKNLRLKLNSHIVYISESPRGTFRLLKG